MISPESFDRRIPTYRTHRSLGATFEAVGDIAGIAGYGDTEAEAAAVRNLAFADLNALPRCGFKNEAAPQWLEKQGIVIPNAANRATRQAAGGLCLRLGGSDMLVTSGPFGDDDGPNKLLADWVAASERPRGWDAHREEGFNWFVLTGELAPEFWTRVCAVDMRPSVLADLDVAQTRAFHMGGIIVRADIAGILAYHMFFDIASSDFLIDMVRKTMAAFDGKMVGLLALRSLR